MLLTLIKEATMSVISLERYRKQQLIRIAREQQANKKEEINS